MQATPSWNASSVELFFWFLRDEEDAEFEGKRWADLLQAWLKLVQSTGRFVSVNGQVATLEDVTAAEYVASDPLDLDHLSSLSVAD